MSPKSFPPLVALSALLTSFVLMEVPVLRNREARVTNEDLKKALESTSGSEELLKVLGLANKRLLRASYYSDISDTLAFLQPSLYSVVNVRPSFARRRSLPGQFYTSAKLGLLHPLPAISNAYLYLLYLPLCIHRRFYKRNPSLQGSKMRWQSHKCVPKFLPVRPFCSRSYYTFLGCTL
jgi:hypothetical protein